jgi:hypothetical protein
MLRASDADREQAVGILCTAAGEGRLTLAELDARLDAALTARTIDELVTVTADLPGGIRPRATAQVEPAAGRWAVLRSLLASGGAAHSLLALKLSAEEDGAATP